MADESDWNACDSTRDLRNIFKRDGEEEFVVVAAVQRQGKRIEFLCIGFGNSWTRNSLCFEAGSYSTCLA